MNGEAASGKSDLRAGSGREGEALNVELRVRDLDHDGLAANEREVALLAAGQQWLIRSLVLGAVLVIAGVYVGFHLGAGWVPADDGTLGQSALRVLEGQLPHRDFAEIYTGGLSMIHALAFRMLGVNLMSLRICVFLFFLAWMFALYYIALRFTSAPAAGLVTLLAVSWSFPNYPAAMPSWYNLFFATFGAAALLRFLEVRTRRWLFVAGVCGGLSIVIKVIGAYYVAGALLFFTALNQGEEVASETKKNSLGYRAFTTTALMLYLAILTYVVRVRLTLTEFYHFVLPSAAMVGLILLNERKANAGSGERFRALFRSLSPFLGGVLVPVAVFLAPYALTGGLRSFASGVMSSVVSRASGLAVIRPAPLQYVLFVLPLVGLLAAAMYWDKFQGKMIGAALGLGAAVIAMQATKSGSILSGVWFSAVMLTPVVVVLGVALLAVAKTTVARAKLQQEQLILLLALAATCSLVQYPFAAPIYLLYSLPLTILALVAIVSTNKKQPGTYPLLSLAGLYLVFGVVALVPMQLAELTHEVGHMDTLELPRGGIRIENERFFEDLTHFLQAHSPNGLLYAGNDCPELYFLSGLKNITRDDAGASPEEALRALESSDVKVVVINEAPFFPVGKMNPLIRNEVQQKFPHHGQAGIFQVFWRD